MSSDSRAQKVLESLQSFLALNPTFWQDFCGRCRAHGDATGYIVIRQVLDECRHLHYTKADGTRYRIANEVEPILARLFCWAYPDYAAFVTLHRCRFDGLISPATLVDWGLR